MITVGVVLLFPSFPSYWGGTDTYTDGAQATALDSEPGLPGPRALTQPAPYSVSFSFDSVQLRVCCPLASCHSAHPAFEGRRVNSIMSHTSDHVPGRLDLASARLWPVL